MESIEITKDNIEKVKEAEKKKLRKIALVVVIACICVALLCVRALDRDKELHIGLAVDSYSRSSDYSDLRSLLGSVVEGLGYSETYTKIVIDKVDIEYAMFNNRAYNLLLLPASAMRKYGSGRPDMVVADLSDSQSMQDIGLEDFYIVLIKGWGGMDETELERLTAIGEALK